MNLKNKQAVITGASNGIGRAVSKVLADKVVKVFGLDRQLPKEKIPGVIYVKIDITKSTQVKKAAAQIKGNIDILFNNAGVMKRGEILDVSEKDFDWLFDIHVKGSWLMLKYFQPKFSSRATIIQMSSRHGIYLPKDPGLYALVKRVSYDFAQLLAVTFPKYRIKILCPGPIDTALSRTECSPAQWKKKERMVRTPEFLADKILELVVLEKTKLLFDQKNCKYYFK